MSGAYRNQALVVLLFAGAVLSGCAGRPSREAPPPSSPPSSVEAPPSVAREGRAFAVVPEASLLKVMVYRGGALGNIAGHNHVIASHSMRGTAWVPEDPTRASFEIHVPVEDFTIDEPELRAQEGEDFPAAVPDSAREGTKKNLLSENVLDGAQYPEIVLTSARIERGVEDFVATVNVTVRGQTHSVPGVLMHFERKGADGIAVSGQLKLKQTDLGMTPFSLFGGALRVEDEMLVKFSVQANASK